MRKIPDAPADPSTGTLLDFDDGIEFFRDLDAQVGAKLATELAAAAEFEVECDAAGRVSPLLDELEARAIERHRNYTQAMRDVLAVTQAVLNWHRLQAAENNPILQVHARSPEVLIPFKSAPVSAVKPLITESQGVTTARTAAAGGRARAVSLASTPEERLVRECVAAEAHNLTLSTRTGRARWVEGSRIRIEARIARHPDRKWLSDVTPNKVARAMDALRIAKEST